MCVKREWFSALKRTIQGKKEHDKISLQTLYNLELDFDLFSIDGVHIFPNYQCCHLLVV